MEKEAIRTGYAEVYQLIRWKRYKEALKEMDRLLSYDPDDADAYALVAHIYSLTSEREKALHWAGESLKRDPEQKLAWYVRVVVYYETDKEKEFQAALQEALRIDPYEEHYYFLKANRLNRKKRFREAKDELLLALEIKPEAPLYLAALSYTEALLGNAEASGRLDREAVRSDAEDPHVLLYLAWAASQRGDFKLQETYMRSAVRLNPESKQLQDEYLEALQTSYTFYRIFLWPTKALRKMRPWQILLAWIVAWALFKPLIIVFIVLYVFAHWATKAIVHVRVFGWRRRGS